MNNKSQLIRYVVIFLTLSLVFTIPIIKGLGEKQDKKFIETQSMFNSSVESLQNGDYANSLKLLEKVEETHSDSTLVKYYLGVAHLYNEKYNLAVNNFKELITINPYMIEDAAFMLMFARTLVYAENFADAKIVLEECQKLGDSNEMLGYQIEVTELMEQVIKSSK